MTNYTRIALTSVFSISVLTGCSLSFSSIHPTTAPTQMTLPTSTAIPTSIPELTSTSLPAQILVTPPSYNSIYSGSIGSINGLFVTAGEDVHNYYNQDLQLDQYMYLGTLYVDYSNFGLFNFTDLQNTKLLVSIPNIEEPFQIIFSNGVYYASSIKHNEGSPMDDAIVYALIPETGDYHEVWSGPPGYLASVEGDYLEVVLYNCYHCGGSTPRNVLIYNTKTKTEKKLEDAGEVVINPDTNTVSYRRLAPLRLPCFEGQGCDNGFYEDYYPVGEFITEQLP